MSFLYKRHVVIVCNLDPKLSTLMVEWANSHNFCSGSLGNCLHYGVGFVDSIMLSGKLRVLKISHYSC